MLIEKIGTGLEKAISAILLVLGILLIIVGSSQVFFRYMMDQSLFWSEEAMRYMFVWVVFLGIGLGVRYKAHVAVDALSMLLKGFAKKAMDFVIFALMLVFFAALAYYGYQLAMRNMYQLSPAMRMPMGVVYLSLPIGGLVSLFYTVEQMILLGGRKEVAQ